MLDGREDSGGEEPGRVVDGREESGGEEPRRVVDGREESGGEDPGRVVDGREEAGRGGEISEAVEAEPEGLTLCTPLGDARGEGSLRLGPQHSSSGPAYSPPLPSQVDCTRCGTRVAKKSIKAHKRSRKCERLKGEVGSALSRGQRLVEGGRRSPRGEKRPHFVSLPPGSPARGGEEGGRGMALRPCRRMGD